MGDIDMRDVLMNNKTNLLQLEEHFYQLADVTEPNTFRNLFPYSEIPKIAFNDRIVPHNMPEEIWITDTTFRDGQQSRAPYTTDQIVTIYDYLHKLGGPKGKIRQSEFFLYSKKDRDAVYKCLERGYKFPEVTSWIRASKKDFELVKEIGLKETGILVSCSDYHIFYKMKMTRREVMNMYLSVIRECLETGISPRCHLEDITRSDIYGFVIPFCVELMKLMDEYKIPIKIRACDTMGYGVNFPGAVIPRSVPGIIYGLTTHAGVPSELIEWHGHNDFYKAVNNSTTAWLYGASGVNCSLFGIGERTGNTPLEAMVFEYAQLRGTLDGMDTTVITELSEYFEKELGYVQPSRTPFVGSNFNVTRAGIHADGLLKNEEIYNIFDTGKFLNRPPLVAVSNTSGLAGIAHWINTYYHLSDDRKIDKNSKLVEMVKEWVDEQYDDGRVTAITDNELVVQFISYMVLAVFAENVILARALGVTRLMKLVPDHRAQVWDFCLPLLLVITLSAPAGWAAHDLFFPWLRDYLPAWLPISALRPIVYLTCGIAAMAVAWLLLGVLPRKLRASCRSQLSLATCSTAVLGTMLICANQNYTILQSVAFALGSGLGYVFAVFIVREGRRRLRSKAISSIFQGLPSSMIYVGVLSLAIYALVGHTVVL